MCSTRSWKQSGLSFFFLFWQRNAPFSQFEKATQSLKTAHGMQGPSSVWLTWTPHPLYHTAWLHENMLGHTDMEHRHPRSFELVVELEKTLKCFFYEQKLCVNVC